MGRGPHKLSLSRRCRLLGISRGSLYYRPKDESPENLALMHRIDEQSLKTQWYGARQMACTSRTHSSLGDLTPSDAYETWREAA